jgi:hypothetical protein
MDQIGIPEQRITSRRSTLSSVAWKAVDNLGDP